MLGELPDQPVRVLVVWEPVVAADVGPPTSEVMGLVNDARARQFWDPEHRVSAELLRTARADRDRYGAGPRKVVWDWVAVFPRDARWDTDPPKPDFAGGDVVSVIGQARAQVDAELARR